MISHSTRAKRRNQGMEAAVILSALRAEADWDSYDESPDGETQFYEAFERLTVLAKYLARFPRGAARELAALREVDPELNRVLGHSTPWHILRDASLI